MKTILLTIIILFLFTPVLSQKKMTDAELDGFKGKVETVIEEGSDLVEKNGKLVETPHQARSKEFYDKNGNVTEKLYYAVNDRGIYTFIDGDKTVKSSHIKEEKFNGFKMAVPEIDTSKPRDKRYDLKFKYDYDSQGRVKEEKVYSNNGQFLGSRIYKYDEKGRLKQEDNYSFGKLNDITAYKYDEKGNQIERKYTLTAIGGEDGTSIYTFSNLNSIQREIGQGELKLPVRKLTANQSYIKEFVIKRLHITRIDTLKIFLHRFKFLGVGVSLYDKNILKSQTR